MALTDNLMAHWALDESSDGSAAVTRNDSHGTHHLTDNNTVPSATGLVGNAASINRDNGEYLNRVGIGSDLQVGNYDWTVVVWLYPTGTGNDTFLQWNGPSGSDIQMRKNAASTVRVLATDAGGTSTQHNTSAGLNLNVWNCVIVSYLATTDQIRVRINDGTAQLFSKASIRQASTEFQIGSTWLGLIDLVSFYQGRALSESEESEHWNGGDGLVYPFTADQTVTLTGVAAAEAVGSPAVAKGMVTVLLAGIASNGIIGIPSLSSAPINLGLAGIASSGAIGNPVTILGSLSIALDGIAPSGDAGSPALSLASPWNLALSGVEAADGVGPLAVTLGTAWLISLTGVASMEATGLPTVRLEALPLFRGLNWRLDQADPVQEFHLTIGVGSTSFRII